MKKEIKIQSANKVYEENGRLSCILVRNGTIVRYSAKYKMKTKLHNIKKKGAILKWFFFEPLTIGTSKE